VFGNDETNPIGPARTAASGDLGSGAAPPSRHREFWRALGERRQWSRLELEGLARRFGTMPDGAIEQLNEAALDRFGLAVCEGEDPIVVDISLLEETLT
jgi:hypothetical protein